MVFPIITYPSAIFYALAEMIVPELTDAQVRGDARGIRRLVARSLTGCLLFSVVVMTGLIGFSDKLGMAVYNSAEAGRHIRHLAWLVPIMYLDSVTDGILRGLGKQVYSMLVNILDSLSSVLLVWYLLPARGLAGYIFVIYFTEIFNFVLSLGKLYKMMKAERKKIVAFRRERVL
jgi:stage V sporulation protein B